MSLIYLAKIQLQMRFLKKKSYYYNKKNAKFEALHPTKLKLTIQDVYAHARNLHVTLYDRIIMKIFDAEAILITLLILKFLHFHIYIYICSEK